MRLDPASSAVAAWTLAGSVVLGTPATATADCECWHYVRAEGATANTTFNEVSAPSFGSALAAGNRGGEPLLARWNGVRWRETTALPLPTDTVMEGVSASSTQDAWAVGYTPDGTALTTRWSGTDSGGRWTAVPIDAPARSYPRAVDARSADDAWIVGGGGHPVRRATAWHWDGSVWRPVRVPAAQGTEPGRSSEFVAVSALAADDVWAVGGSEFADGGDVGAKPGGPGSPRALVAHWDGRTWSEVPMPEPAGAGDPYDPPSAGRRSADPRSAPGGFGAAGSGAAGSGAARSGAAGSGAAGSTAVRTGAVGTSAVEPDGTVSAAAQTADAHSGGGGPAGVDSGRMDTLSVPSARGRTAAVPPATVPAESARSETVRPAGVTGESARPGSLLSDVAALARDDVWAVGTAWRGTDLPLARHWNGRRWRDVPLPGVRGRLYSVASDGQGGVWTAGESSAGTALLAHWNGERWDISGAPTPGDPSPGEGLTGERGAGAVWGLAHARGTSYLWAVGAYARPGPDEPVQHLLTWTNAPRHR